MRAAIGMTVRPQDAPECRGKIVDIVDGETTEGRTILVQWGINHETYEYASELFQAEGD